MNEVEIGDVGLDEEIRGLACNGDQADAGIDEGIKSEVSNNEARGEAASWKQHLQEGIEKRERERSEISVQSQDPQQLSESRSNEEKAQDPDQPTQATRDQELTADNKYMNDLCPDEDKMDALRKARDEKLEEMTRRSEKLPPDEYTIDDPSWREH